MIFILKTKNYLTLDLNKDINKYNIIVVVMLQMLKVNYSYYK